MKLTHPDIVIKHIKTKNKLRKIVSYRSETCDLKNTHKKINDFLERYFCPSIFTKGYVRNQSIFDNAYAHMYNDFFITLDIKNFFQQICLTQLYKKLYHEINLVDSKAISLQECKRIVDLCSISTRGIPLGFVTSPILSNIYLKEFDCIFFGKLKKMNLNNVIYTRYADDLTISFKDSEQIDPDEIKENIICLASSLLSKYGLHLNNQKTRFYNLAVSNHVRITGVNIIRSDENKRRLTVGRSVKNKMFWDAINSLQEKDEKTINHIKGMQSFILSVEKKEYEDCFSSGMKEKLKSLGFDSLKSLIDSL